MLPTEPAVNQTHDKLFSALRKQPLTRLRFIDVGQTLKKMSKVIISSLKYLYLFQFLTTSSVSNSFCHVKSLAYHHQCIGFVNLRDIFCSNYWPSEMAISFVLLIIFFLFLTSLVALASDLSELEVRQGQV